MNQLKKKKHKKNKKQTKTKNNRSLKSMLSHEQIVLLLYFNVVAYVRD